MGAGGTIDIAILKKVDVEQLLDAYDADPVGALTAALRLVLDRPHDSWAELIAIAPLDGDRRAALDALAPSALDGLLRELNELRTLG
jgi:hypothetical protein